MAAPAARYPVFIPSKGRADIATTPRVLDRMGVPWRMVVEEAQLADYARHWPADRLLVLDPAYQRDYDSLDELPWPEVGLGSGPPRNFCWDLAAAEGAPWFWTMDDNILLFYRLHANQRIPFGDATPLAAMEDFCDRYTNIGMAGPQYEMFCPSRFRFPPFVANRRVMSCQLTRTDVPLRFRGRYNEDVILCLDLLKAGWATVCFNAFLQEKAPTQTFPGGNTHDLYGRGTLLKSQVLAQAHPDVARVVWRYGRWHHHVDYSPFRGNQLGRRPDWQPPAANPYRLREVPWGGKERAGRLPAPWQQRRSARGSPQQRP
jgi:hypothetical protein